jgi:hypothetical protein
MMKLRNIWKSKYSLAHYVSIKGIKNTFVSKLQRIIKHYHVLMHKIIKNEIPTP